MKKILILPLMLLLLTTGCSDDDNNNTNVLIPISLNSRLVVQPRPSRQDVQIADGQQVSFYVTHADEVNTVVYNNALLTADGEGNFDYLYNVSDTALYYPLEDVNVDLYAVHPYIETTSLTTPLTFSIMQNQANIRDFLNSDLLYSRLEDVVKQRNSVNMVFNHKLSKITFTIRQGVGIDLTQLNLIEVQNVEATTIMNVETGNLTPATSNLVTVIPYGVRAATTGETELVNISAIIVPQTFTASVASNKHLFRFRVGATDFFYTPASNINFETGRRYHYTITITNAGIEVTSSIENWLPGSDTEGEGIID